MYEYISTSSRYGRIVALFSGQHGARLVLDDYPSPAALLIP